MVGVITISSPFTAYAQNGGGQTGFCENSNVNLNDVTQIQSQRQQIDSTVKESPQLSAQQVLTPEDALSAVFGDGTLNGGSFFEALLNTTGYNIVNACFNINNNDLSEPTFTGGTGGAQTGTGGADTTTGDTIIE